jgi:Family of unknown function (DUF6492)
MGRLVTDPEATTTSASAEGKRLGLAVLTPSYAPDLELCRELNRSVLTWTAQDVNHHLVVPRRDYKLFAPLDGSRTRVWTVDELVPRGMLPLPKANAWLNLRRPYPPIRGWVMQQIVKLVAASKLEADVLVLADSDVTFVRPITVDTFRKAGQVRFYRGKDLVHAQMRRHLVWHDVARRLLGLPPAGPPPLPDYISAMNTWDRQVVLAMRDRIEDVTGRPWLDAIASQLHVSEFILYGVFMDEVLGTSAATHAEGSMLCHSYWGPGPLEPEAVPGFVQSLSRDDVAVMISAKTNTEPSVRREALSGIRLAVGNDSACPVTATTAT